MRITVDLDEELLAHLKVMTGETKKSPAVAKALSEFVRQAKANDFAQRLLEGEFGDAFDPDYDPEKFDR